VLTVREHVKRVHQIVGERLTLCTAPCFRESLEAVFRDRLALREKGTPWFMLPIFTCEALGGDVERAHHVAAGLEIGRIAAGCLDEWQDHDTEDALWQAIGPEQTVSLAVGMIALSLLAVAHLAKLGVQPASVLALQWEFELALLRMTEGQHADLSDDLALDDYETVAGAKSGALLRLGCRAGTLVAGASAEIAGCYGEFGYRLGILAQVWNDVRGLAGVLGKKDAEHRRALPILAALAVEPGPGGMEHHSESVRGQVGHLYTLLQLSLCHQRASEALARCPESGRLSCFLDEYDPGRLVETMG
jgi:geranylgeranyl pyrophosphate synthase